MLPIDDSTLDRWIAEDHPYLDLTTHALGIGTQLGGIRFTARHPLVICGTEEASRLLFKLGANTLEARPSGTQVATGHLIVEASGTAASLHAAWKVCLNLLEHASGVATLTASTLAAARAVNPRIELLASRKSLPGTRALMTKAVLCGGGSPHRLGLSETILVFDQHRCFLSGETPAAWIARLRAKAPEKKVIIETDDFAPALEYARAGAEGIQFDKVPPTSLTDWTARLKALFPGLLVLAAGGIRSDNAAAFAATGVDGLVTSALFSAPPADIGVRMEKL